MNTLLILQVVVSVLLIATILLQAQGAGLGSAWGGGGESYHTKRGLEKALFTITGILIGIFTLVSLVIL